MPSFFFFFFFLLSNGQGRRRRRRRPHRPHHALSTEGDTCIYWCSFSPPLSCTVSVCVCTMADFSHQQKKGRKRRRSERRRDGGKDHYQKGPLLSALSSPACAVLMHCIPPPLSLSTPWFSHSNGHTKIPVFVPKNDVHRGSAQDVRVVSEERGEIEAILFWMRAPPPLCNARHIFITSNDDDDEMNSEKWLFKFIAAAAAGEMRDAIGSLFYLLFYFECETMVTSYFPMQEFTSSSSFAFCFSFLGLI